MRPPVLRAVHIHPVKSLAGCEPGEAAVEPWGLDGDRRWMLVDTTGRAVTQRQQPRMALVSAVPLPGGGIGLSAPGSAPLAVEVPEPGRTVPVALHRSTIEVVEAAAAAHTWFSERLGTEVRLVHLDAPGTRRLIDPAYARPGETVGFADGYPLLLASSASLDALNSLIAQGDHADEGPLPMNRFRPNVVVDGTAPWAEDGWDRIAIGDVPFRVVKPCDRCVITTTDQGTAERGKEPLRTLARHRRVGQDLLFGQYLIPDGTGVIRVGDPVRILG
ncbi:MOSC domain-containing protein [Streptomyces sp. NBC_00841]|uniref:MOSC domain-containing protein n=1 Tax=unclassified Streptomyces TaxID=2593676 RepID=UPI002253A884|nr:MULTISPECIES: MOSC N-terminal beta barrel domain-containing protein [unclassified Streptomyces]MCX4536897.1 MOSC domain-containing protein [Streptomyces sp. NBC_01669]WRZ97850.1 MOSC domain-containing protein [Streptomyces sp. NBC_00841]